MFAKIACCANRPRSPWTACNLHPTMTSNSWVARANGKQHEHKYVLTSLDDEPPGRTNTCLQCLQREDLKFVACRFKLVGRQVRFPRRLLRIATSATSTWPFRKAFVCTDVQASSVDDVISITLLQPLRPRHPDTWQRFGSDFTHRLSRLRPVAVLIWNEHFRWQHLRALQYQGDKAFWSLVITATY